jgi:hypothetical protein
VVTALFAEVSFRLYSLYSFILPPDDVRMYCRIFDL